MPTVVDRAGNYVEYNTKQIDDYIRWVDTHDEAVSMGIDMLATYPFIESFHVTKEFYRVPADVVMALEAPADYTGAYTEAVNDFFDTAIDTVVS
jgi:hypothetical protein